MAYESKRSEFRNYIDRSGIYNALLKALQAHNKEDPKPQQMIYYIRHKLCETCPEDEKYDAMCDEVDRLGAESLRLERELEDLQNRQKTPEEVEALCLNGLKVLRADKDNKDSYLLSYLNEDIIEELKELTTSAPVNANLFDCCEVGFRNHDIPLGLTAIDAESFDVFSQVFEPSIKKAYGIKEDDVLHEYQNDWGELSEITNVDPEELYVTHSYIIVSRNLHKYPFAPKMTEADLEEIEETILVKTNELKGEYVGRYFKIENFTSREQAILTAKGICFKNDNPRLRAAKCYRFWPASRGVYCNEAENFAVFINWVDHLRVKSFANNGDLGKIYYRLLKAFQVFEPNLFFACHEIYGFLSPDILNLGSGIVAGVNMKLPNLTQLDEEILLNKITSMGLNIKKLNKDKQILEVQIAPSFERNEFAQIKTLNNACEYLINSEKEGKLLPNSPVPVKVEPKPIGEAAEEAAEPEGEAENQLDIPPQE